MGKGGFQKIEGSYPHLKEVRIRGYMGLMGDLELVMHLCESGGALKSIVIDPRKPADFHERCLKSGAFKDLYVHWVTAAWDRAMQQLLGRILPPRINLQIL